MVLKNKHGYWNKNKCQLEANKYNNKKEFKLNSPTAYSIINKNKWTNELCAHMINIGSLYKRCVYVYEFNDNSAYIGLTCDLKRRNNEHLKNINGSVYKHLLNNNITYKLKQLSDYIDKNDASNLEIKTICEYSKKWKILNKNVGGALGKMNINHTKENCQKLSLLYKSRTEFSIKSSYIYAIARKNKWLNDICKHMYKKQTKEYNYWTKNKCIQEVLKYNTWYDFYNSSQSAYTKIRKNNWLEECKNILKNKINNYD